MEAYWYVSMSNFTNLHAVYATGELTVWHVQCGKIWHLYSSSKGLERLNIMQISLVTTLLLTNQ